MALNRTLYTSATGENSYALGENSVATGSYAYAFGKDNKAIGNYSVAIGLNNVSRNSQSVAIGTSCITVGNCSPCIGTGLIAYGENQCVVGAYNRIDGTSATLTDINSDSSIDNIAENGLPTDFVQGQTGAFEVGIGYGNDDGTHTRLTAFKVMHSGEFVVPTELNGTTYRHINPGKIAEVPNYTSGTGYEDPIGMLTVVRQYNSLTIGTKVIILESMESQVPHWQFSSLQSEMVGDPLTCTVIYDDKSIADNYIHTSLTGTAYFGEHYDDGRNVVYYRLCPNSGYHNKYVIPGVWVICANFGDYCLLQKISNMDIIDEIER